MQHIFFAIGHFFEWAFTFLSSMGWLPVILIAGILAVGFLYWMMLQARYNAKAREDGTIA
ncbi:MAG: hypothetical protein IPP83_19140 [Flavobacteriales bacterium]|nr:hypothetical protein [Flavobacteriales bacterium]